MKKLKLSLFCILALLTADMTAQSLNIGEQVSLKMVLKKSREVTRPKIKPKLESLQMDIDLNIKPRGAESSIFTWQIKKVSENYKGIPKGDRDNYKKALKGIELTYEVDREGKLIRFMELKDGNKIIDSKDLFDDGSEEEDMSIEDEGDLEDFMNDLFEEMYYVELLDFVKKYHSLFSMQLPEDNPEFSEGSFEKKIAKEKLASKVEISYKQLGQNTLEYYKKQRLNIENSLYIFEKEEEAFRPFKKDYLLELLKSNKIVPSTDLTVRYDLKSGLIERLSEVKLYRFSKTNYRNNFEIEILSEN